MSEERRRTAIAKAEEYLRENDCTVGPIIGAECPAGPEGYVWCVEYSCHGYVGRAATRDPESIRVLVDVRNGKGTILDLM